MAHFAISIAPRLVSAMYSSPDVKRAVFGLRDQFETVWISQVSPEGFQVIGGPWPSIAYVLREQIELVDNLQLYRVVAHTNLQVAVLTRNVHLACAGGPTVTSRLIVLN